ncbi:MAG: hypothetical protein Q8R72_10855 [Hylemonella sp.]|nr:hypothetical protein [Hylemonella sp.]
MTINKKFIVADLSRAFDEASGIKNPRIWTAERDQAMWAALQG